MSNTNWAAKIPRWKTGWGGELNGHLAPTELPVKYQHSMAYPNERLFSGVIGGSFVLYKVLTR